MENKTARNVAIIGTIGYLGILTLVFLLVSFSVPQKAKNPPEGVDVYIPVLTEIQPMTGGQSDMDYGTTKDGGGMVNQENSGMNKPSNNNLTQNQSNHSTNESNVQSNTNNNWNNVWNTANNSNGQGNTQGNGDQGNTNGTIGGHGDKPCKGCQGSGVTMGNGDATYLAKPSINNGDEGRGVVKVKFDKNGIVQEVYIKQKGTFGNISDDSWAKIKKAAYETRFNPDPEAGSQLRTGYLSYDLHPN